jgi:tetratricopeptide (TPR) repeat protein
MEVLAKMYQQWGQLDKAIDLLSRTLHHREILHGPDHVVTLKTKEALLLLKSKQDGLSLRPGDPRYHEMAKQVEDLVVQQMSLQGPDHPGTWNAQASLAEFYADHDQHHLALPICQAVVKGWAQRNGMHDFNTLRASEMLARLHEKLGNTEDAIMQWRQVVEGYWKTGTILDDDLERAVLSLARLYTMAKHYDDEVVLWDQVLNDFKRVGEGLEPSKLNGKLVMGMVSLATEFEDMERYDNAVAQWKRAIEVAMISCDFDACKYVGSLAELFHRLGRDEDAVAQCKSAVKWVIKENLFLVDNLEQLARQFEKLGWYDKAVPVWKKLIGGWDSYIEWNFYSGTIRNPMRPLAEALDEMGQYKKAAIQWERAFKWDGPFVDEEALVWDDLDSEPSARDRLFEMESAANAYEKAGMMDKAEAIRKRRKWWEKHGEDVEMNWDILRTDQEEDGDEDDEDDEYKVEEGYIPLRLRI